MEDQVRKAKSHPMAPPPEQILILESIFNSGMVNPPKDDTVRIRKLLERFGPVGDANVFYWFQNRRSRSRRRQRQLQAGLAAEPRALSGTDGGGGGAARCDVTPPCPFANSSSNTSFEGFVPSSTSVVSIGTDCSPNIFADDSAEDLFSISRQMGFTDTIDRARRYNPPPAHHHDASSLYYQPGLITVFINGIPQEVPSGPFDAKKVFGPDAILLHSSGELVPMNDCGILFGALDDGESYILLS
ncbi:unnamed protein product [Spirodela intermedia]|uniref:Homeobox domain-containing protein n=1 Tax=Spirodela intermedia TaxID=51605 RepID=A0A7I8ICE0_SPIIN|nr:unnamed protein product [Spirodela intermedia]CAA6654511.1 unnamed protein product [Spirodela intermedia]